MKALVWSCSVLLCLIAASSTTAVDSGEIRLTVTVGEPEVRQIDGVHEIVVEGFGGLPVWKGPPLPSRIVSVAIPPGAELLEVSHSAARAVRVPGVVRLRARRTRLWSGREVEERSSTSPELVELVATGGYRSYNLVDVRVSPFSYEAASGRLSYTPEVEVIVRYRPPSGVTAAGSIESRETEAVASSIIANHDQARSWFTSQSAIPTDPHDFVVITVESLRDAVAPLVAWEREKGRTVAVVTTFEIAAAYEGYDLAEKIRSFLREKYPASEWGIQDVLLVGHPDYVPMRRVWAGDARPETDFYYAELSRPDGESWDSNHNRRHGERYDNVDLYGEVNVGRVPWSDFSTVERICEKSVAFEKNADPAYKNNVLLLAAIVDSATDGAVYQERIVDPVAHPWMSQWTATRLYEASSSYPADLPLNRTNTVATWAAGRYSVVSWHSHGSPTGVYAGGSAYFHVDDCDELNDDFPAIVSAASCSGSDTDYLNLGQVLMRQGAVGFLGANKAAYYAAAWDGPEDGSDQSFKYFFLTELMSGRRTQGQAHQYALREMYTRGLWDDPIYETFIHGSLWGNPDLGLVAWPTNQPPDPPSVVEGAHVVQPGTVSPYTATASDPEGETVTLAWDWGDGTVEWTGPHDSGAPVEASHCWQSPGVYDVRVMVRDADGAESAWSEPLRVSAQWRHRRRLGR